MSKPLKTFISNKIFIAFLLVVAGVLGSLQFVQWKKRTAIEQEVAALSREARELEARNNEINESLEFLHTQSAKERIAREQLGMKKDGEIVVSFQDRVTMEAPGKTQPQVSNRLKWWNYFFSERTF